jgi:hypothetical protein
VWSLLDFACTIAAAKSLAVGAYPALTVLLKQTIRVVLGLKQFPMDSGEYTSGFPDLRPCI